MGNIISRKDFGGSSSFDQYSALSNDAGNVTSLTDSTQTTVATYSYEAFGNTVSQSGTSTNSYKFSTKNLDDESGLYYFGARYYDPETGRFITKDPDGGDLDNPLSQNPYIYANDNPVNLVDPDGEFVFVPAVAAEIAIAVGLTIAIEAKYHPIQKGILATGQAITKIKNWYLSKKKGASKKS